MQTNIPTDRQGWGKELGKVEKKIGTWEWIEKKKVKPSGEIRS